MWTFRAYGLSWDEPLFYDYAAALPYAYTPKAWLSGDFDLERAFGSSASDHANRGPAYVLLARPAQQVLQGFGLDLAAAWHLTNFTAFQIGAFLFLYQLCLRWMRPWPAAGTTALLTTQPLLWGHAFINPKDPPFLIFFTAAVWLGLELVDCLVDPTASRTRRIVLLAAASVALGLATAIRVVAPLAGMLVLAYAVIRLAQTRMQLPARERKRVAPEAALLAAYVVIGFVTMLLAWPYLWPQPLQRFAEVLRVMAANPTQLAVLFRGEIFRADALPGSYLPVLLGLTITEPVWPAFAIGILVRLRHVLGPRLLLGVSLAPRTDRHNPNPPRGPSVAELFVALAWFALPVLQVLIARPPMYDGYRHFLFILPPVFLAAGLAIDAAVGRMRTPWLVAVLLVGILIPGVLGIIALHPYEYAYYNSLIGGTGGAFRSFETDYWLTCYKEAVEDLSPRTSDGQEMFVRREPFIAAYYAGPSLTVRDYRLHADEIQAGDYVLVNTRSNEDLRTFHDAPVVVSVGRGGATFCLVKRVP